MSTLLSEEVEWSEQDQRELLGSADDALNRLTALVTNLLDLCRLQADALVVTLRPVGIDDVLSKVVATLSDSDRVALDVSASLPEVAADPGLVERVVANVLENALRYTPKGELVRVIGSARADRVVIQVIDSGPGIQGTASRRCSSRFSAATITPSAPALEWGSAWPSRAVSSRPCRAASSLRTPRAAASPCSSNYPPGLPVILWTALGNLALSASLRACGPEDGKVCP